MGSAIELNRFLADVEKRAYAMALVAVRNPDDALDIVQDAMLTLARKYASKPVAEWRPLFFRVLRNRIIDFHRSNKVRSRVFGWFAGSDSQDNGVDPIEQAQGPISDTPEHRFAMQGVRRELVDAVGNLPQRQQQAFMLRAWEGLDVKSTAVAMRCSAGSVKTHFSRAVHSLRTELKEFHDG